MRGVSTKIANLEMAAHALEGQRFDVLWFNALLSYVAEPVPLLRTYGKFLSDHGVVVVSFDNHRHISMLKRRLERDGVTGVFGRDPSFEDTGIHRTDARVVRSWLRRAGFAPTSTLHEVADRYQRASKLALGIGDSLLGYRGAVKAVQQR
jgi:hypothetical protein